jgi:hypothetical protein
MEIHMNKIKQFVMLTLFSMVFVVNVADAASHKIGILVFDGCQSTPKIFHLSTSKSFQLA